MRVEPATGGVFNTVVKGGFCIGCGACAAVDSGITMKFDEQGKYVARQSAENHSVLPVVDRVCPFSENAPNEDLIATETFDSSLPVDQHIGAYHSTYAGHVEEAGYRDTGSSGGLVSWLLVELLERGIVDHVVHVSQRKADDGEERLFSYRVSSDSADIRAGAKSRYYPVEMSAVIKQVMEKPGRYAVVGVPCFIKAIRLVARENKIVKDRIGCFIGLFCGHLKSQGFAELAAWESGIQPSGIDTIDFRVKQAMGPASSYAVSVSGVSEGVYKTITKPSAELSGSNWGHGLFKYRACDFCDDVVAETADVSIGDAWLEEYAHDPAGTNIVIVRDPDISAILEEGISAGKLCFEHVAPEKVYKSQEGGFRHRRQGLSYRLQKERAAGRWVPPKRVEVKDTLDAKTRRIQDLRQEISGLSHEAFREAKARRQLEHFHRKMEPLTSKYDRLYVSRTRVLLSRVKQALLSLVRIVRSAYEARP